METISGEILAEELQTLILQRKINTIADKINDYFDTINQGSVDIPEFMKPVELQRAFFIQKQINIMLNSGTIDHFYKLAIDEGNYGK